MKIPFVDLKEQYLSIKENIDKAIYNVIDETAFIGGKYVQKFESDFAQKYGIKNCISVANGTDSLYIIMKMLGIGNGDEVITVSNSWISSSETITQVGALVVFVDIDPVYYTINADLIESKITEKTKAIMPVHLYGQMCDMKKILNLAAKYNLYVIEDCAQSHFSEYEGHRAGTFGIAGSFSFYPGKNLGAYGDAGCIITNDDELAEKCRTYARHGAKVKHKHIMEGINSRLDGIQAAILSEKLPHILEWTKKRIQNAVLYTELLKDVPEIVCPVIRENTLHSFHLYVVKASNRNGLIQYLTEKGIETAIHYPTALPNLPAYKYHGSRPNDFPVSSANQEVILSLPMYPELTLDQINYIAKTIIKFYKY
jgi:dTDP-4-amino-4,6-dideoxygalactose transaminase